MLDDAGARALITCSGFRARFSTGEASRPVLCIDHPWPAGAGASGSTGPATGGDDLAYIMYTSGSTGQPKGVMVPQRAVARLVLNTNYVDLGPTDVVAHLSNVAFDAATFEIWGALLNGGRLVALHRDAVLALDFGDTLARQHVTTVFLTTALFNFVVRHAPSALSGLRTVLFGGEPADPDAVRRLLRHGRPQRLVNAYGPTESTTFATAQMLETRHVERLTVPIGRPIANTTIYILDAARQPVPIGVTGELYIGGDGLARGYVNRPDLTADRFVANPFVAGVRLYRTGDRGRWRADGSIEFIGRADHQIKLRGFRIEPGEIEAALASHPSVHTAAVVVRDDPPGDTRLVAHVVPAADAIDPAELRRHVRQQLPEYMVPAAFLTHSALPTTSNRKVDRKALAAATGGMLASLGSNEPAHTQSRTPVVDMLASIWADVLGVQHSGIDDDFFELGGHSLLAARLMLQLSDIFRIDLPLRLLFEAPTISRLAAVIQDRLEAKSVAEGRRDVLEINISGTRPPLFFLHAALQGDGFYCFNLARHLGDDQPMYALAPLGLDGGEAPDTIETIAARQLQTIRRIQPHGPYFLGGFCASGPVALEIARMLKTAGERVETVVIIESYIHEPDAIARIADRLAGVMARVGRLESDRQLHLFRKLRAALRWSAQQLKSARVGDLRSVAGAVRRVAMRGVAPLRTMTRKMSRPAEATESAPPVDAIFQTVSSRYLSAIDGYVARPFEGRVVYLKAETSPAHTIPAWRRVAPGLQVDVVAGDHNTCITTRVDSLGAKLRTALRDAQDRVHVVPAETCPVDPAHG
jgi:amino acid adenylation domain-containing protein